MKLVGLMSLWALTLAAAIMVDCRSPAGVAGDASTVMRDAGGE